MISVDDPVAFLNDPNATVAIVDSIALLSGVPSQSIEIRFKMPDGRRLVGSTARNQTLGVEFTISLPFDAFSDGAAEAMGFPPLENITSRLEAVAVDELTRTISEQLANLEGDAAQMVIVVTVIDEHVVSFVTLTSTTVTSTTTTTVLCGNGLVESYEAWEGRCDDGNQESGDGCDSMCFVEEGWHCQSDANEASVCSTVCGDGVVGKPLEECDDGNKASCDSCSASCLVEPGLCILQADRLCQDGFEPRRDLVACDFCQAEQCKPSECCILVKRAVRHEEVKCGDGILLAEEALIGRCDDGNLNSGDGCDSACFVEPGWICSVAGKPCATTCGDGIIGLPNEDCDDGNSDDLDGCSSECRFERGRCVTQAPSLCVGGFAARTDIPPFRLCHGRKCSVQECCLEFVSGGCPVSFGNNMVFNCTDGHTRLDELERKKSGCDTFNCPAGWQPRTPWAPWDRGIKPPVCEDPSCQLRSCCIAESSTCTCESSVCCAVSSLPPPRIVATTALVLSMPVVIDLDEEAPRWFYVLSSRASMLDFRTMLGSQLSAVLKGYLISLPASHTLETLLSKVPEIEFAGSGTDQVETQPRLLWTSSSATDVGRAVYKALIHRIGFPILSFFPDRGDQEELNAVLEVSEAFTVVHGTSRMRRLDLEDDMLCCFTEDHDWLQGVPIQAVGATFFALSGSYMANARPDFFTVVASLPVIVYALDAIDPFNKHGDLYKSGFEDLGWEKVASPGFLLQPNQVHMGCWRRALQPHIPLQVPHGKGLFGSVAVSPSHGSS